MDDAQRQRRRDDRSFKAKAEELKTSIQADHPPELLKDLYKEFEETFKNLKVIHEKILDLTDQDKEEDEDKCMQQRRELHSGIRLLLSAKESQDDQEGSTKKSELHKIELKKMELPKFTGDIKTYTRFKTDSKKFVEKATHPEQLSFRLRSCLGNEVNKVVQAAEDDYEQMWTLLDEKYGDRHKLVNALIGDILKQKPLKEGEDSQIIQFIELIPACHRNLKRMAIEHEMNNAQVISEIESRLPEEQRRRWVRLIHEPQGKDKMEKDGKLKTLLDFLEEKSKSLRYMMSGLQWAAPRPKVHSSTVNFVSTGKIPDESCLIHEDGKHTTQDSRMFKSMTVYDRIELMKQKRACFRCLKIGHQVKFCKLGRCGKEGCTRKHHPLIHYAPRNGEVVIATQQSNPTTIPNSSGSGRMANAAQQNSSITHSPCILMAKELQTCRGEGITAMFDSACTSSAILSEVAERLKLKRKPLTISITKFSGETECIDTYSYILPLKTREADIKIEVFGMPHTALQEWQVCWELTNVK
ncbi:uncharacterized protein LOC117105611 [Anneissia japonica]|uniref:uncharacterized protein LOC117105611 n=1 Tax=Anneissia japonica TaxID=1529436 RepID=UPI001425998A|nr:uncharacterized protein LOC117105611 [Anneissia japonica]